ncbi:DUF2780 domain-containing protein [Aliiglaciecola sp. 2_MG-2023]|uniref:DUF2780 domain-containing protein n=1 Tax=unclassified Aliiglaciecola TaxID=2593648 RepID=UPI0026E39D5C|nr:MULTISPECIES: DUF2780 domain-containing protein [unclassified Aliiglaciecola]MDO6709727.1 DUF2780 domain-containing protein [Aliiglaciecola sp. 2_MG-2023]MDO6750731.1 DUF2780 domain-containing protein [Aliiglaciecola sp. 1_MG-2023]
MKTLLALLITTLTISTNVSANDTVDKLKGLLGNTATINNESTLSESSEQTQSLDVSSLVSLVSDNLGVSETQSEGGLASIFDYAKNNLSGTDYTQLAQSIPGLDSLLENVPTLTSDSSSNSSSVSGLLNKASEYSSSLSAINELKQQFEALGLDTDMIANFIAQINSYFSEEEDTLSLLQSGLGNIMTVL